MSALNAYTRLLSNVMDKSLNSIKAKKNSDTGKITVRVPQKRVTILVIPAKCYTPYGGETFAQKSAAENAFLTTWKPMYINALSTFCFAAYFASKVDVLCEMLTAAGADAEAAHWPQSNVLDGELARSVQQDQEVIAYRFYFIDRIGAAAAAAAAAADDDEDEMQMSSDEDDGSEDGAIAAAGVASQKKEMSFAEALLKTVQREPCNRQMAANMKYMLEEDRLLNSIDYQRFAYNYSGNLNVMQSEIKCVKYENSGLTPHQLFTWEASEVVSKKYCTLSEACFNVDKYLKRNPPTAQSEHSYEYDITHLFFEDDCTNKIVLLNTSTLLAPTVFGTLRRPDVDLKCSRQMRNPSLDFDADMMEQICQSAVFSVVQDTDIDEIVRQPAYTIMYNTLKHDYDDALASNEEERFDKLLALWKQAATHWQFFVMSSKSIACKHVSLSMRSWLGFIQTDFMNEYDPPVIPFSVDAGIISNFVHWLFAGLESYFLMLKQHSNFFKLYCMMLGATLPRDNGRVLPFVCMLGPAMASKSYLLDCLRQIMLKDTTTMVTSSSNKARTTGYDTSFEAIELYDDATAGFLQTAKSTDVEGVQQRQELLKQILTNNDVSHQMASSKEMPNKSKRKVLIKESWKNYNGGFAMATNHVENIDPAIQSRIHEEFFAPSRRENKDVSSLQAAKRQGMNNAEWSRGFKKFIKTMQQFQTCHNMITAVMKSGVLPAFEFKVFDLSMKYIEHQLRQWGIPVPSPRTKERMQCLVQTLTILRCWLSCYVYKGAIFYQQAPSFLHIHEWARHVCSDSTEAVLQTVAMMSHSLIGESVAKNDALHVLFCYITSESCISRKWYTNTIEDAKQLFLPNREDNDPKPLPQWVGKDRGCSWCQLKAASFKMDAAQQLRESSPATAKRLLADAEQSMTQPSRPIFELLCKTNGLSNNENMDVAQPVLDKIQKQVEDEAVRCCECSDCKVDVMSANYVVMKQTKNQLASAVYNYWNSHSEFGEPMSEAELIRTFDVLAAETMSVAPAFVLQTDKQQHVGARSVCYMKNPQQRTEKQAVFSAFRKDCVCISLGAMIKSKQDAAKGGVCLQALLSSCKHKYMEESTLLLSIPNSIVEPQFPKLYRTSKSNKTMVEFKETIGPVQARAMGLAPQPRYRFNIDSDLEYYSKKVSLQTLGLDVSTVESVTHEGRLSAMLTERFKTSEPLCQSPDEFTQSLKDPGQVITKNISTQLA